MNSLRIALSGGALLEPVIERLEAAGLDAAPLKARGRRLLVSAAGDIEYIIARPTDVPTYVEWGAVDIGLVGSDVLMEEKYQVFELLDLAIGCCKFVLAGPDDSTGEPARRPGKGLLKVATKYTNVAAEYLNRKGLQAEIIKLYGSIELAPLVGLADQIVDLKSTGRTLAENGLKVIDEIAEVSCRLIANYVSYKLKSERINELIEQLKQGDQARPVGCRKNDGY